MAHEGHGGVGVGMAGEVSASSGWGQSLFTDSEVLNVGTSADRRGRRRHRDGRLEHRDGLGRLHVGVLVCLGSGRP